MMCTGYDDCARCYPILLADGREVCGWHDLPRLPAGAEVVRCEPAAGKRCFGCGEEIAGPFRVDTCFGRFGQLLLYHPDCWPEAQS